MLWKVADIWLKLLHLLIFYQPVRKGTNGGVTKTGLLAAAAGGSVIGLSYFLLELSTIRCGSDRFLKKLLVIPIATTAGLGGSIIDSLFGATLQFSGFCSIRQKVNSDAQFSHIYITFEQCQWKINRNWIFDYWNFSTIRCRLLGSQDQLLRRFQVSAFLTTMQWTLCLYCWQRF